MTKKDITEMLKSIPGWTSFCFNSNKRMPSGTIGFVDYVLLNEKKGIVAFIECKLGYDKLSQRQESVKTQLEVIAEKNSKVLYMIITDKNYEEIIKRLVEC